MMGGSEIKGKAWHLSVKRLSTIIAVLIFSAVLCQQAHGDDALLDGFEEKDPASADSLLDGFEARNTTEHENARNVSLHDNTTRQKRVRLTRYMDISAAYNFSHDAPVRQGTDWQGLSSLKTEILLELAIKPADKGILSDLLVFASGLIGYDCMYTLKGREKYTDQVLDTYETNVELRELYLQLSPAKQLDIKTGRQIVVWGTSDFVRVVDSLNPLDLKNPGATDIEDLRLPVAMSKIDYYQGAFQLSGIMIHEVRFNETPAYGSIFYPSAQPFVREEEPDSHFENSQFALALNGRFSGWDLGLYWADIYHPDIYTEAVSDGTMPVLTQRHERVKMFGASSTLAAGNFIIKAEAAYWDGLKYTHTPKNRFPRLDVMAGLEYSGFAHTRITLELLNRHLFSYKDELKNDPDGVNEDQLQSVICVEKAFMHETLTLSFSAAGYGEKWQGGSYQRILAAYDIADNITAKAGVVFYQSGELPMFHDIGGNDQLFLELKVSF